MIHRATFTTTAIIEYDDLTGTVTATRVLAPLDERQLEFESERDELLGGDILRKIIAECTWPAPTWEG